MITPNPAAERGVRQLDQLLTHYIGPMARIVLAKALKAARDDADLVRLLADQLDLDAERAAFMTNARTALAANPVIPPDRADESAADRAPAPSPVAAEPPRTAPAPPPSAAGPGRMPLPRPAAAPPAVEAGAMKA